MPEKLEIGEPVVVVRTTTVVNPWVRLIRCCLVEFSGDLIFIFIGALSATAGLPGAIPAALAHGIAIFVLITAMGHISGGHFNPAVTIGVLIAGGIRAIDAVFYIISQLLGGFVGALLVRAACSGRIYATVVQGGITMPGGEVYPMEAITCEIIFTYLLVLTVLLTAVDTDLKVLAPLAIGCSILVDIVAGGTVSGASMNPARSFGPAVAFSIFENSNHWRHQYVYYIGQLAGAGLAGLMYRAFFGNETKRWLLK